VLGRITATTDYAALAGCDLIVEAVFEDPKIKAEVTAEAEAVIPADCIFATNTSTLPISDLAQGVETPRPVHRHPLLLAGRQDAAGRDHPRPRDRRPRRGQGARLRAPDPQDADRGERRALLLRQPLHHPLHQRGHPHGGRGRAPGAGRKRRQDGGHAARAAAAGGRDLDRPRREDRQGHQGRDGRCLSRRRGGRGAVLDGDQGRLGRKSKAGFYAYDDAGKRIGLWDGSPRATPRPVRSPISPRCSTG
jgi:3-hydroxyacyl-CoA dehydrogenase/enoyl-CoA hydratase/3-hydroxybutyryl-CoA epimerase